MLEYGYVIVNGSRDVCRVIWINGGCNWVWKWMELVWMTESFRRILTELPSFFIFLFVRKVVKVGWKVRAFDRVTALDLSHVVKERPN